MSCPTLPCLSCHIVWWCHDFQISSIASPPAAGTWPAIDWTSLMVFWVTSCDRKADDSAVLYPSNVPHTFTHTHTAALRGKDIRFADHRLCCLPLTVLSVTGQWEKMDEWERKRERNRGGWRRHGEGRKGWRGETRMRREKAKIKKQGGEREKISLIREDTGRERKRER